MVLKVFHIRVTGDEPKQFIYDGLQVKFLGGEKRESLTQVISRLVAEHTLGAGTGSVAFHSSVFTDMA
jgi:hypothetical protein